jgi:signal transduction histidine kinase
MQPDDREHSNQNNFYRLVEDSSGAIWAASEKGLHCLDPQSGVFTSYFNDPSDPGSLADNSISALIQDSRGGLWVGTRNKGLDYFDYQTGKFTHYLSRPDDAASLNGNNVLSIFIDRGGVLWVGTTNGLNRFDRTSGKFQQYREKDGLPNEYIYAILQDPQGSLWMSTNKGISRFDPSSGKFRNYDSNDGLQSNEFNAGAAFQSKSGEMFFGGIYGFNSFFPDVIQDNPYPPAVVLTSLTRHGEQVSMDSAIETAREVTLKWPDNYFDFEFVALNFVRPEQNQYAYKLEGFDNDWNMLGNRHSGRYTNLPGRTYTLHLKAANNDGVWNEAGTAIKITVVPPVWDTWWFRGLLLLGVAVVITAGIQIRTRSVEKRNQELERVVHERTNEIEKLFEQNKELAVMEERKRLALDLHDSAKQKAFAALAQLGAVESLLRTDPSRIKTHLDEAETLVYDVIQELSFLIQEMYPAMLKEKGLATALREYVFEWENRTDIRADLHINEGQRLPLQVEQSLYRVVQEALANVARHSHASHVEVSLDYHSDQVEVKVADNGVGFDTSLRSPGVGLRSMDERVALIHGSLKIESNRKNGTQITIQAPLDHHH